MSFPGRHSHGGVPHFMARALLRRSLPESFERWRVVIAPGTILPTAAEEWAGSLVLVESGVVEVGCLAGSSRTFVGGDLVVLCWLPLETLSNPGPAEACLVAVRRRDRD